MVINFFFKEDFEEDIWVLTSSSSELHYKSDLLDGEIVHINKNSSYYSQELYFSLKMDIQVSIWFEKIKENTILKFSIPNKWEKDSLIEYSIIDPTQIEENTKIILKEILLIL